MNLEKVEEHFKNAKEVRCAYSNKIFNIDVRCSFYRIFGDIFIYLNKKQHGFGVVCLCDNSNLAEIISYKDNLEEVPEKIDTKNQFKKVADSMASLLEYKNEKYGNAVLEPVNIFSGKCKAGTRLDDKLSRIKNNEKLLKNDVSDLIGYLMLTCVENGWDNFDEFKD